MPPPDSSGTGPPHLQQSVSGLGFFSLAFGSMIGVGWITALGAWFTEAGPIGAAVAFGAGGALMVVIGLCYAELTPMLPVAGGEVAYAYKAFGTRQAFIIGWFLAFGYLSVSAFEAISVGTVLSFLLPGLDRVPLYSINGSTVYGSHLGLAVVFTAFITGINYRGVALATRTQTLLTLLFLALTLVFVASGIAGGDARNLAPAFGGGAPRDALNGMLAVFVTTPFWFVGFDTIPQAAEERRADAPIHRLGLYVILSILGSTLFYVAVILGAGMATPWRGIVGAALPTAAAFEAAFDSRLLVDLVLAAGMIGLITSWNGFFLAASRVVFALGRGGVIATSFGATHPRYGTPANAALFSGGVTLAAACLGRGAMLAFVDVASFCIVLAFLGVALSLVRLRAAYPRFARPYTMPGGTALACVAAAGALGMLGVMLCPGSPGMLAWPLEWMILGSLAVGGIAFWIGGRRYRARLSECERAFLILGDYC